MFGTMGWLRPSPAMVVAVIALAAALAGVAYATIPNQDGSVSGCYQTKTGILRVVDVGAGGGCTKEENAIRLASVDGAGRVADANKLGGAAPSAYQHRVSGTCFGTGAVQGIFANGTVDCSDPLAAGDEVHRGPFVQVAEGSQRTLLSARGINVIGRCTDDGAIREEQSAQGNEDLNPPFARLEVSGANYAFASISNAGFQIRIAPHKETVQIAGTSISMRGDFNLFNQYLDSQLDGSFAAFAVDGGSSCIFEASGISGGRG